MRGPRRVVPPAAARPPLDATRRMAARAAHAHLVYEATPMALSEIRRLVRGAQTLRIAHALRHRHLTGRTRSARPPRHLRQRAHRRVAFEACEWAHRELNAPSPLEERVSNTAKSGSHASSLRKQATEGIGSEPMSLWTVALLVFLSTCRSLLPRERADLQGSVWRASAFPLVRVRSSRLLAVDELPVLAGRSFWAVRGGSLRHIIRGAPEAGRTTESAAASLPVRGHFKRLHRIELPALERGRGGARPYSSARAD